MTKTTKKQLQEKLDAAISERIRWEKSWGEERQKRGEAEASLKESREHFADLKERLSNAESETARLRGYLDRVHEDDIVRDGMVEIEDDNGKRTVPKRPPPMQAMAATVHQSGLHDFDNYGQRKKRVHWTSY